MRKKYNRNRNREKKERFIMLGSAVFVLAALTMTGVYVKGNNEKEKNDGYTIDFATLEKDTDKQKEQFVKIESADPETEKLTAKADQEITVPSELTQDDFMDYLPPEGSTNIAEGAPVEEEPEFAQAAEFTSLEEKEELAQDETIATGGEAIATIIQPELSFTEQDTLSWPIVGNVLINYSMDKTTYFATLEQYKYSPAIVISATEGENIAAAADGKVVNILEDEEIGNAVVMDLGNGYQLTYGQLKDIKVSKGSYVKTGEVIGSAASPTKYYSVEGCNVYFKLTKDGAPVNPMGKLN